MKKHSEKSREREQTSCIKIRPKLAVYHTYKYVKMWNSFNCKPVSTFIDIQLHIIKNISPAVQHTTNIKYIFNVCFSVLFSNNLKTLKFFVKLPKETVQSLTIEFSCFNRIPIMCSLHELANVFFCYCCCLLLSQSHSVRFW